ncbi:MAG TPA: helix-turn-helix domain-containing protein [Longimicrobium sp.]|nr:helix-turn-helix domain-containing protein [Longimicrobium sp.]
MTDPIDDRPPPPIHPPRQARSRETLTRLLDAAEAVLRDGGLEAATVPAIAERAGLSVGAVYRRFADKDALLRAVHERSFHRLRELNESRMAPELFAGYTLEQWIGGMIRGLLHVYRQDRRLMQAMMEYSETHKDAGFRARAAETNRAALASFAEMVKSKAAEVRHPHPDTAARFALITVGLVLGYLGVETATQE